MDHDAATAIEFLYELYRGTEDGCLSIVGIEHHSGRIDVRWGSVADLASIKDHVDELAPARDVYFGVAPRRAQLSGNRRGGDADCQSIPALWVDVDIADQLRHRDNGKLPRSRVDAQALITAFPLRLTAVVHSGGGYQPWWALAEPIDAEEAELLLARWHATWDRIAASLGFAIDPVFDLARVMRLPGTVNRKVPEDLLPVKVAADWSLRYGFADLDEVLDEPPEQEQRQERGGEPWLERDWFNERNSGHDVLVRARFTVQPKARSGQTHYSRPDREGGPGRSATVYSDDGHTTVWSNAVGVPTFRPFDAWGLYTFLNHAGDFAAASKAVRDQLGAEWQAKAEGSTPDEWEDPLPLIPQASLPTFPTEALPSWVGAYVRALAESLQVPLDLPASLALSAMAAATGGRAQVEVTADWIEPTNLFTVTVLPSGERKSATVRAVSKPLRDFEQSSAKVVEQQIFEAESFRKAAKRARDLAEAEWAKADEAGRQAATEALKAAAVMAESVTVPVAPRLLADDATPEALALLMAQHGGRMALLSPEGGIFDIIAGRYGGDVNLDIYLKGHAGDAHRVDRIGRASEYIDTPALTLGLAVQPDVARSIATRPGFRGRGLLARNLYTLPMPMVGRRRSDPQLVESVLRTQYEETLRELVTVMAEWVEPMRLTLTACARDAVMAYLDRNERRLGLHGDLSSITDWGSKLPGAMVRIAGGLHLAEHRGDAYRSPIQSSSIARAVDIADFYVPHALAVFDLMGADASREDAHAVLRWLMSKHLNEFSRRDAFVAHRSRFPRVDALDPVLVMLQEHGWIRPVASPKMGKRGGRPSSPKFEVHPRARD
jgi:hypothetical protein